MSLDLTKHKSYYPGNIIPKNVIAVDAVTAQEIVLWLAEDACQHSQELKNCLEPYRGLSLEQASYMIGEGLVISVNDNGKLLYFRLDVKPTQLTDEQIEKLSKPE